MGLLAPTVRNDPRLLREAVGATVLLLFFEERQKKLFHFISLQPFHFSRVFNISNYKMPLVRSSKYELFTVLNVKSSFCRGGSHMTNMHHYNT